MKTVTTTLAAVLVAAPALAHHEPPMPAEHTMALPAMLFMLGVIAALGMNFLKPAKTRA